MNSCKGNCCDTSPSDYDDIIEQLKETRNSIDRMIKALEQRKVKDNVINQILNTEYEDESEDYVNYVQDILDSIETKNYTIPKEKRVYYPYIGYRRKFYPYFY